MSAADGSGLAQPHAAGVYGQLGQLTRQLHAALDQLGVMPGLQAAADGLPDVRGRLDWIARKAGDAAERVLGNVEEAKIEQRRIADALRELARAVGTAVSGGAAPGSLDGPMVTVTEASGRIDALLTDIMLAQDFHDLIGQVTARMMRLCAELEQSLVRVLLQAAPSAAPARSAGLEGPQTDARARSDVVRSQGEVDDLLASLGF